MIEFKDIKLKKWDKAYKTSKRTDIPGVLRFVVKNDNNYKDCTIRVKWDSYEVWGGDEITVGPNKEFSYDLDVSQYSA